MRDVTLLRRVWPFVREDGWALGLALAATPLAAALSLVQPYLLKLAIDRHLVPRRAEGLGLLVLAFLGAAVAAYVLEATYALALSWTGQRTVLRLRRALYRRLLRLAQSWLDRQPAGRLLTRLTTDLEAVEEAFTSGVVTILLDLLLIGGALGAMLWLDAGLTAVVLVLAPPLLLVLRWIRRRLRRLYMEVREALAALNAYLSERLGGIEVIQLFRLERAELARFERRNRRFRDAMTASNWFDAGMYAVVDGAAALFVAALLWWGSGGVKALGLPLPAPAGVSAGVLVAFVEYIDRLFRPLRELAGKVAVLQRSATALEKVFGLLDEGELAPEGAVPVPPVEGRLVVRGLRFRYRPDGPDVLDGVDLEVAPGELVAVVGSTGSGKTTLIRLLSGAYTGYEGSIRLDGIEIAEARRRDLVRQVAGVRQDVQLFSETLRFNVALGREDLDDATLEAAARDARADVVVERLGWEFVLRERGADLSAGEAQLVTLARVLAHGPRLVLLDEATANIDSVTEDLVQAALDRVFAGRTVVVVAHRLSTVRRADRIVVMEEGRIVEEGSHAELLRRGGRYAELVRAGRAALVA